METERVFVDTNVFLYAASMAPEDARKKELAAKVIHHPGLVVSSQVIQEFISAALRRPALGLGEAQIDVWLGFFSPEQVQVLTLPVIRHAIVLRRRYQLSHWDSTIIAAALAAGCGTLFSEDLSHGQVFDSLTVHNPLF
ncbi:PIN domain-containing protein [bacterium]|nr:PIN domain-containing protein [bacterium]